MAQTQALSSWKLHLQKACIFFSILSAVVLLIVWALADTIAARNISIAIGLLTSSIWVLLARPKITRSDLIVPALLMGVPIWLWVIYFFFPIDPVAQYKEMTGTWLRVMLLIIFGFNLGLIIATNKKLVIWIWLALASLPIAALMIYLRDVYIGGIWDIPNYTAFFKTKIAGVYFLMWPYFLVCSIIHRSLIELLGFHFDFKTILPTIGSLLLIIICFYMFYVMHALNGFLIAAISILVLFGIFIHSVFKRSAVIFQGKVIILLGIICILYFSLANFLQYDRNHDRKLTYLAADINVSLNIRGSSLWRGVMNSKEDLPMNSWGAPVNQSTYERISWFLKGTQYLILKPYGSGDLHYAFGRYMNEEYPGSTATKTHCGWLDYALGVGIPGVLLLWLAFAVILKTSFQQYVAKTNRGIILTSIWMICGSWVLWWPGEISYREFFEHYFFICSTLGVVIGFATLRDSPRS